MRELPYGNDRLTSKSNAADTRKKQKGGIAQLARASALQAEGRRFDSDYLHKIKTSFGRLFFVEISFDPQSLCDSPQGHAAVVFAAIGHLRPPFSSRANIIEHADWPYSGVELHFSCSMRSKWRHRASLSALQPPGTPLALLDELHEERFARRTIRTRDDAEEGSREKRRERQNAEKNTKGKTRRSLLELESVKIRIDRLTLLIRICNSSGKRLIFRTKPQDCIITAALNSILAIQQGFVFK